MKVQASPLTVTLAGYSDILATVTVFGSKKNLLLLNIVGKYDIIYDTFANPQRCHYPGGSVLFLGISTG